MPVEQLTRREKERILAALERDKEFRYALMGLLGFSELLNRFARLEERQQRLEERQQKLEERFARIEERFARLEERQQKLEERFARLEKRQQRLEEHFVRLEERQQRLEEHFARLEERQQRLEEEMRETRRIVMVIAHRFGVLSESAFREAMRYVVREVLGVARVEKWVYRDEEGLVYGYPAVVEVDLVVKDGVAVLVEVKSRVSRSDVAELSRIGVLYERVTGTRPRLIIVGGMIDPDAYKAASSLGVEIVPAIRE